MIDCKKASKLANKYIDGLLSKEEWELYEEHIFDCNNCMRETLILRDMSEDVSKTEAPLPDGFSKRLHNALVEESLKKQEKKKFFAFPYHKAASLVMAVMVIAVVGKFGIYDIYKNTTEDTKHIAAEISGQESQPVKTDVAVEPVDETDEKAVTEEKAKKKEPEITNGAIEQDAKVHNPQIASVIDGEPVSLARSIESANESIPAASSLDEEVKTPEDSITIVNKYLSTFIDQSKIKQSRDKITVTINEDEYDSVMEKILSNEHVHYVTESTSPDGTVTINIR